jgi:hypothetical protein
MDLIYLGVIAGVLGLTALLVVGCGRLMGE